MSLNRTTWKGLTATGQEQLATTCAAGVMNTRDHVICVDVLMKRIRMKLSKLIDRLQDIQDALEDDDVEVEIIDASNTIETIASVDFDGGNRHDGSPFCSSYVRIRVQK